MRNLWNRLPRPNRGRAVTLRITDNQGSVTTVTLLPGDTLDINHTINDPQIKLALTARAAVIEVV